MTQCIVVKRRRGGSQRPKKDKMKSTLNGNREHTEDQKVKTKPWKLPALIECRLGVEGRIELERSNVKDGR